MGQSLALPNVYGILGWSPLFTLNGFTELFTFDYTFANFLICGWMASGTSYFLSMLVNDDGIKINQGAKK